MPDIRFDDKAKMYYLEYYNPRTGKRERPRISNRRDIAAKKASDVFRDMIQFSLGTDEKQYSDIDLSELVKCYFQSIDGRLAPSTIRRYVTFANNFSKFIKENFPRIKTASNVRRIHIEELLTQQKNGGQVPTTLNNQIFVIRSLLDYAVSEGFIKNNPAISIKRYSNRRQYSRPKFWTRMEIEAILNTVRSQWRDSFEFLYVTGLRVGEMINLTWDDVKIDSSPPTLTIQSKGDWVAKTKGIKIIPINSRAVDLISNQTRSEKHNRIFKGPQGGKIKYDDIHHRLDEALSILCLTGNLHKFRHTFASLLSEKGKSIQSIGALLGHKGIQQTLRYAQLGEEYLKDVSESLLED